MQRIGVVGLGLMGSAIVQRLVAAGFEVTGYDVDADKRARLAQLPPQPLLLHLPPLLLPQVVVESEVPLHLKGRQLFSAAMARSSP